MHISLPRLAVTKQDQATGRVPHRCCGQGISAGADGGCVVRRTNVPTKNEANSARRPIFCNIYAPASQSADSSEQHRPTGPWPNTNESSYKKEMESMV